MSAEIIDGKGVAAKIRTQLRIEIYELKSKGINPGLAVILIGDDPASHKYVTTKEKACYETGITSFTYRMPSVTQKELLRLIDKLNSDPKVSGILVQMPLPKGLHEKEVMRRISPSKDVDGFGPEALGSLLLDEPGFISCTPHGIIKMLEAYNIDPKGKHAVVVGRSVIVGKPLALLLLRKHATVTIAHSKTPDLKAECLKADILCVAIGKTAMITADMVKEGSTVIDIGINISEKGKITGDVDFDAVKEKAQYITPVPGGVGPMTIAMLLYNTVQAAKMAAGLK